LNTPCASEKGNLGASKKPANDHDALGAAPSRSSNQSCNHTGLSNDRQK
jgi:hypothetical protein